MFTGVSKEASAGEKIEEASHAADSTAKYDGCKYGGKEDESNFLVNNSIWQCSTMRKRKSKMNKHKLKKRRKKLRMNTKQTRN